MAIDFRTRDFLHPLLLLSLHRRMERNQWASRQERQDYQWGRLASVLRHAANHVPYYRRLFARRGLQPQQLIRARDLSALPLLRKNTLRGRPEALHSRRLSLWPPVRQKTSGSSGEPIDLLMDARANAQEFVYYLRYWGWGGFRLGDSFAQLTTAFFLRPGADIRAPWVWQAHLRRLLINTSQLAPRQVRSMARAMVRHRPSFLKGLPSELYHLGLLLRETGASFPRPRAIFTGGELLSPAIHAALGEIYGCPVLDSYGHMERTVAISHCPAGSYHVHDDYGMLELLHPRPGPDPDTRVARAVGTSLYNRAMPLLRYDTGDDILLYRHPAPCPCGRTFPVVKGILGRSEDIVVTPGGRYLPALFVLPRFTPGVRFLQLLQESPTYLRVLVVPGMAWGEQARENLEAMTRSLVGPHMGIHLELISMEQRIKDPSGKVRTVISRLPPEYLKTPRLPGIAGAGDSGRCS